MKTYFKLLIVILILITVAGCKKKESPLPSNAFLRKGIEYKAGKAYTFSYVGSPCGSQDSIYTFVVYAVAANPLDTITLNFYNLPSSSGSYNLSAFNFNCLPYSVMGRNRGSYTVSGQAGGVLSFTNNTYSFKNIRYYDSSLGEDLIINISGSY